MAIYGGVEAGGTKIVCAVGSSPKDILAEIRFPTTTPGETLDRIVNFFHETTQEKRIHLDGIGIGSFGPLDLNPQSASYGMITSTPKPNWAFTEIRQTIQDRTGVRAVLDTDVNAAAIGEGVWGAAQGLNNFVYLTIGTGIGGGFIADGKPYHGLIHPEMGHFRLARNPLIDPFEGYCPYHKDCFEGLASGPALKARFGQPAETLPADHPAWDLEADYIAQALHTIICITSPERIILGGGVMQQPQIFPLVRQRTLQSLNGYVQHPEILENISQYIVPPALGNHAGVLGAIALARQAFI
jgi:fructokinase